MRDRRRSAAAATLLGALLLVGFRPGLGLADESASAEPLPADPLPTELLAARSVFLMDTAVMDEDLKQRFRTGLEEWERFEIVLFPDEADVLMSLSARADYTTRPIEQDGEEECDEGDPLCDRAEGTTQIVEKVYLKIFIQGGDELWADEESVADGGVEAADRLIGRLRDRVEASERAGDRGP